MKDEATGEVPVAFIVRSNGFEITEDEIKEYIAKQVRICLVLILRCNSNFSLVSNAKKVQHTY